MADHADLSPGELSEVIEMALADHISFGDIKMQYGLSEGAVKTIMRKSLKPGGYRAWRKRVRQFLDWRVRCK